jgi:benzaldehyde dehydrogenase (NAD)
MSFLDRHVWTDSVFTGTWQRAAGGVAAVVEPATGKELASVGVANADDIAAACAAAAAAQPDWAATSFEQRAAVLRAAGTLFEQHAAEFGDWIVRETGAIPPKAGLETHIAAQECFEAAALASRPLGSILPTTKPRLSLARRVPVGVVGVISPFNFPLILSIRSVAAALAVGNAVVLKPDPRTPVSGGVLIARVLEQAGLPAGVLHVLPGGADAGAALVEDPHTRVISFTGSTAAGRKVGETAGRLLKRAHLELGGNNALIVRADADLDRAVSAAAFGSFLHQGQICMTTGRHLVHESIADEYVARLTRIAQATPVGDPATSQVGLGPIIDAGQRDKVHDIVTRSVDAGARLAAGGEYDALFYRPTVLDAVRTDMPAWQEEVFGPVAPVVRFADDDEAAHLAADTEYGLSLGILSADVSAAMRLADRIDTGIVHINDQTVDDEAVAPFGGTGASGTGARFGGAEANLEAFTEVRWYTVQGEIGAYPFHE